MNWPEPQHLTTDELDGFLLADSSPESNAHVAACTVCAALVASDARLVDALSQLPLFDASPRLADHVLAQLARPGVAVMPATPRAAAARRRAIGIGLVAGGSIAAAFAWAAGHPGEALRWSGPAVADAGHTLWLSWQALAANATSQPWFGTVRDTLASPMRVVLTLTGVGVAYLVALNGLRRLMTAPEAHAAW